MKNTQSINSKTKIFGILGNPLSHTLSPGLHNGLFQTYNYDALYLVFESPNPEKYLEGLRGLTNLTGCSVTIPFKEWAYNYAGIRDNASIFLKTSNTLVWKDDAIYSYNTDGPGALKAITDYLPNGPEGDILILGSGGSAKGIAYSLKEKGWGKKIYIVARNRLEGEKIVESLEKDLKGSAEYYPISEVQKLQNKIELVIHTTPLGMKNGPKGMIIDPIFFHKEHYLFDIVYNPLETPLVKSAIDKGTKIIPGYLMLLYQGIEQFYLFTGIYPEDKNILNVHEWLLNKLNKKL